MDIIFKIYTIIPNKRERNLNEMLSDYYSYALMSRFTFLDANVYLYIKRT